MQVLFVEDDAMNRRVVGDMLQMVGAQMTGAEDAETGLSLVDERSFNIILMDLRMPGIDGLTAIDRIRARVDNKATVPIIVVTADTALNIRSECIERGADEVILKPVAMKQLFDAMGKLIVAAQRRDRVDDPVRVGGETAS